MTITHYQNIQDHGKQLNQNAIHPLWLCKNKFSMNPVFPFWETVHKSIVLHWVTLSNVKKKVLPGVLFHVAAYYISNVLLTVGTLREKLNRGLNISQVQICWERKKKNHMVKTKIQLALKKDQPSKTTTGEKKKN